MKMYILIISIACLTLSKAQDPKAPVWENQFEADFHENFKYPIIGSSSTEGKFFYDFTNKRYRVDRENGKYDRYCGSVYKFRNTPCTHYVVDGIRYLDFPEKDDCCNCCDAAHGCGILKPDWLNGAEFGGIQKEKGVQIEKWVKKGLQDNIYYTYGENRIPYVIDQQPNDVQIFKVETYRSSISNASVFDLPKRCKANKKCGLLSICTFVQK